MTDKPERLRPASFALPESMHEALQARYEQTKQPKASMVRDALTEYLKKGTK